VAEEDAEAAMVDLAATAAMVAARDRETAEAARVVARVATAAGSAAASAAAVTAAAQTVAADMVVAARVAAAAEPPALARAVAAMGWAVAEWWPPSQAAGPRRAREWTPSRPALYGSETRLTHERGRESGRRWALRQQLRTPTRRTASMIDYAFLNLQT
jgi:hypothetical protein